MTFFSYGFRPFFLLGGVWAPLALVALLAGLSGTPWPADAWPLFRWHGHEMIFGFVATAIAGFLLTAVPTWTQSPAVSGSRLAGLAALWIAGRIVVHPLFGLGTTPAALLELAFFPVLAATLAAPLIRTRNVRNYPFVLMLTLLFVADLLFHALHGGWLEPPFDPLRLAANLVLAMIVIVGGRIIPAFTRNALVRNRARSSIAPAPWLERAALAAAAAVAIGDVAAQDTQLSGVIAGVAALLLAMQLARWEGWRTLRMPIVLVLHAGFAWLVVALALKSLWLLTGVGWAANWLHAQAAGAFGTMILAVTTRVALGHSGRPLAVGRAIVCAYVLAGLGTMVRVWGGIALPAQYVGVLAFAMTLWAAAFVIFVIVYLPILVGPRADELPSPGR